MSDSETLESIRTEQVALKAKLEEAEKGVQNSVETLMRFFEQGNCEAHAEEIRSMSPSEFIADEGFKGCVKCFKQTVETLETNNHKLADQLKTAESWIGERDSNWIKIMQEIAKIDPSPDVWEEASVDDLLEEYDPWDALRGIGTLNTALSARVEALEVALEEHHNAICAMIAMYASSPNDDDWNHPAVKRAKGLVPLCSSTLNSTPAADLAAHDLRVKREVVEKIIKASVIEDHGKYTNWHRDFCYRAAGIPPSTETEEKK